MSTGSVSSMLPIHCLRRLPCLELPLLIHIMRCKMKRDWTLLASNVVRNTFRWTISFPNQPPCLSVWNSGSRPPTSEAFVQSGAATKCLGGELVSSPVSVPMLGSSATPLIKNHPCGHVTSVFIQVSYTSASYCDIFNKAFVVATAVFCVSCLLP